MIKRIKHNLRFKEEGFDFVDIIIPLRDTDNNLREDIHSDFVEYLNDMFTDFTIDEKEAFLNNGYYIVRVYQIIENDFDSKEEDLIKTLKKVSIDMGGAEILYY